MKNTAAAILFLLLAAFPAGAAGRFIPSGQKALEKWEFSIDGQSWTEVSAPHSYNASDGHSASYYRGCATYLTTVDIKRPQQESYLIFEGAAQKARVYVNGQLACDHRGGYTAFSVNLKGLVHKGRNAVEVVCDNTQDLELIPLSSDFNKNGGLHNPAWIFQPRGAHFSPSEYGLYRMHVTQLQASESMARARVQAFVSGAARVTLKVRDTSGKTVYKETKHASGEYESEFSIPSPHLWNGTEDPYLYTLVLEEDTDAGTVYESYRVGFRKITYKTTQSGWYEDAPVDHDLIRINGQPIMFRGVNRHETHPELGYALTREVMEEDIRILLENNINAVRTSHYPNHPYWYYLCDRYGIYVVDEANIECHSNMTTENERLTDYLSTAIIDREYSMIRRDRNHPSVVMWSLGNENKNPLILRTILVESYPDPEGTQRVLHQYTKDRPWHYEQARDMYETGIDVRSGMYALPEELIAHGEADGSVPMIECEYEHAMGNSEGNFDEYWDAYENYRNLQGGFIWDLIDQSIYLINEEGERYFGYGGDYGERIHDGNFCANGLLLPDRTVQPEMAEVRYFYQQI